MVTPDTTETEQPMKTSKGKVYLVGAGPGDPELITVKGLKCIEKSDVIIYDYLASKMLLEYSRNKAELIYVGKKGGNHTLSQDGINSLIIEKAQKGAIVTRLKGGDPFIFGRGGEEAEVLIQAGIPFEIIPGVTSAIAAPAYAGIPLTHRKFTSTVAFVTGHEDPNKEDSGIDWSAIAKGMGTLVFLMGVKNLPHITEQLMSNGMLPDTPVALIRWGTTPKQVTVTGTLDTIVERVKTAGLKAPAIIVIGHVVSLRETMKWFENRPLMGKRIVVTRAREQASELVKQLSELGAECLEFPTIEVVPPNDWKPLDAAIENLSLYDWLIFTSVNGVTFFFERLFSNNKDLRALNNLRTAAIGPATAKRLFEFGLRSDIIPDSYRAESIVESFRKEPIKDKRILLPRAKEARPILPEELKRMGAIVDEIAAYCTKEIRDNADNLLQQLEDRAIDMITFTSSSTVKNFKALIPKEKFEFLLKGVAIASIGPITADTAKKLGFEVHVTAESYTIPGLCKAIEHYFNKN
jgi:uroporphyrinogen III methyltransferase/synthase